MTDDSDRKWRKPAAYRHFNTKRNENRMQCNNTRLLCRTFSLC